VYGGWKFWDSWDIYHDGRKIHGRHQKRLFTHYRRGLYIDTGVGDSDYFLEKAAQFCRSVLYLEVAFPPDEERLDVPTQLMVRCFFFSC
jgi:hypothetical protein